MSTEVPVKQTRSARAKEIERRIREAGERAGSEADARRFADRSKPLPAEKDGPRAPEPTRYGDWEHKGLASDF